MNCVSMTCSVKTLISTAAVHPILLVPRARVLKSLSNVSVIHNLSHARSDRSLFSVKPKIYLPPRYQGTVEQEKNETLVIKVPFKGYPQPTASWSKDGVRISANDRYQIETADRFAILTIKNTAKEDTGIYNLVVENELGQDTARIELKICDVPDPPRFPVVENVLDEAVVLSWKPPLNDGGSYITNYIVEKREVPGDEWKSALKTRYTFTTVEGLKSNATYEFRVIAENKYGLSKPCEATAPVVLKGRDRKKRGHESK